MIGQFFEKITSALFRRIIIHRLNVGTGSFELQLHGTSLGSHIVEDMLVIVLSAAHTYKPTRTRSIQSV